MAPKRLRMFAGPNGSGKSSLIRLLARDYSQHGLFHLNRFINADDFLGDLLSGKGISFVDFDTDVSIAQLRDSLVGGHRIASDHPFLSAAGIDNCVLNAPADVCDSYIAATIADFLREKLFDAGRSFSFETVMSHGSKIDFFARARESGYRTYLYFIATDSPRINRNRVEARVAEGGHNVPLDKIRERYERTLRLAGDAIAHAYRAFIFDNSGIEPVLLAEFHPDGRLEHKVANHLLPGWFLTHIDSHI